MMEAAEATNEGSIREITVSVSARLKLSTLTVIDM
jgi:hypothetical protein